MTDLLSSEHSILERPFMEFRPFGLNDQGEKISDISGVVVQSNVDYLCDYLTRTAGSAKATDAVEELCRLLNTRLPRPHLSRHARLSSQYLEQLLLRIRLLFARILRAVVRRSRVPCQRGNRPEGSAAHPDPLPPVFDPAAV